MSRASAAYDQLTGAMGDIRPECLGLDLFTADDLTAADQATCAAICENCPLLEFCRDYAELAKPKAGVWAGKTYRTNKPRKEASG